MSVWYNDPRDGFAKLGNMIDAETVNTRVDFSEAVFKLNEEGKTIECYLYANGVTDVAKSGEKGWSFEPQPIYFQLHGEEYEKSQGKGKSPVKVEPKPFTKLLYQYLSEKCSGSPDKHFAAKGFINFVEPMNTTTALMLLSGKNPKGGDLTPDQVDFFTSSCFGLDPIDQLEKLDVSKLPDFATKKPYSGNGYGGARGQTELERLRDRFNFVRQVFNCAELENLEEIAIRIQDVDSRALLLLEQILK